MTQNRLSGMSGFGQGDRFMVALLPHVGVITRTVLDKYPVSSTESIFTKFVEIGNEIVRLADVEAVKLQKELDINPTGDKSVDVLERFSYSIMLTDAAFHMIVNGLESALAESLST